MYKQFFLIIAACCMPRLHSMQSAITMPANERLVWQIVLTHGVNLFDYTMIDSLVLSKNHDAILHSTAECRKQFFMQRHRHLKEVKDLEWNGYGTVCAKASWGRKVNPSLYLQECAISYSYGKNNFLLMEIRYLLAPGKEGTFMGFYDCLPHSPRLFFSGSHSCFHGYGHMNIYGDGEEDDGNVIEYCVSPGRGVSPVDLAMHKCVTQIKGQEVRLMTFLEFPVLLKAFLNSSIIEFQKKELYFNKIYALEGVEIPKNFLQWKKYFSTSQYNSFKDLPRFILKAIVERYNEQAIERKKLIC